MKDAPKAISAKPITWLIVMLSFSQKIENSAKTASVMTS